MRYVEEYRARPRIREAAAALARATTRPWPVMEICGGQTHAIARFGLLDLLPPEIFRHYEKGEYKNKVVDFPDSKFRWDDGFDEATKHNGETLVLDENKQPVDKTTKKRPEYIQGSSRSSRSRGSAEGRIGGRNGPGRW